MEYYYSIFNTNWGWMGIVFSDRGLVKIILPQNKKELPLQKILQKFPHAKLKHAKGENFPKKLTLYFKGKDPLFNFTLDLSYYTPFQKKVWKITSQIQYGEVATYSEIGEKIVNKFAARAVGSALKRNPLPIIIPCHRVIRKNGELGGFLGTPGIKIKARLLELEGITLDKNQKSVNKLSPKLL